MEECHPSISVASPCFSDASVSEPMTSVGSLSSMAFSVPDGGTNNDDSFWSVVEAGPNCDRFEPTNPACPSHPPDEDKDAVSTIVPFQQTLVKDSDVDFSGRRPENAFNDTKRWSLPYQKTHPTSRTANSVERSSRSSSTASTDTEFAAYEGARNWNIAQHGDVDNCDEFCAKFRPKRRKVKEEREKPRLPKKNLDAYSLFFKEEFTKIVSSFEGVDDEDIGDMSQEFLHRYGSSIEPGNLDGRDSSYDCRKGVQSQAIRSNTFNPEKRCRSGKLSFKELGRVIEMRWKNLSPERMGMFEKLANRELDRYRAEMELYTDSERETRGKRRRLDSGFPPEAAARSHVEYEKQSLRPTCNSRTYPSQSHSAGYTQGNSSSMFSAFSPPGTQVPCAPVRSCSYPGHYGMMRPSPNVPVSYPHNQQATVDVSHSHPSCSNFQGNLLMDPALSPKLIEPSKNGEPIRLPPPRVVTAQDRNGVFRTFQLMYAAVSMPYESARGFMKSLQDTALHVGGNCNDGPVRAPGYSWNSASGGRDSCGMPGGAMLPSHSSQTKALEDFSDQSHSF